MCTFFHHILTDHETLNTKVGYKNGELSDTFCVVTRTRDDFRMLNNFINHYLGEGASGIWVIEDSNGGKVITNSLQNVHIHRMDLGKYRGEKQMMPVENLIFNISADQCEWIVSIDSDEFIVPRKNRCNSILEELNKSFQGVDSVSVPWIIYTASESDVQDVRKDVVMRWNHSLHHGNMSFLNKYRDRFDSIENKPIFRRRKFVKFNTPHAVILKPGSTHADGVTGDIIPTSSIYKKKFHEKEIDQALLAINHYRFPSINQMFFKCTKRNQNSFIGSRYSTNSTKCLEEATKFNTPELMDDTLGKKMAISQMNLDCNVFWTIYDAVRIDKHCPSFDLCCWIDLPNKAKFLGEGVNVSHSIDDKILLDHMEQIFLGQGTTGTHYFFDVACKNGLRALHWVLHCNFPQEKESILAKYMKSLTNYAKFPGNTVAEVISKEINLLIFIRDLQTQAFSDTGLINLASVAAKLSPKATIFISYRRPDIWAHKRSLIHGSTLICTPPWSSGQDAFQWTRCVANSRHKGKAMYTKIMDLYMNKSTETHGVTAGLSGKESVVASFIFHNNFVAGIDPQRTKKVCIFSENDSISITNE